MEPLILKYVKHLLRPVADNIVTDCIYFLRKDGSFVFTEGYLHEKEGVYGRIIYYPDKNGIMKFFNIPYGCITKEFIDGDLRLIPHKRQYALQFKVDRNLKREVPPFAKYRVFFEYKDFLGYFDHRYSLNKLCEKDSNLRKQIEMVSLFSEVKYENLGCTGSLSFGITGGLHDDIDIAFYCTVSQARRFINKLFRYYKENPEALVYEFGRAWPIRFYLNNVMICSFFIYLKLEEIPLKEARMEVEALCEISGRVKDDTHTVFNPPVLILENVKINGKSKKTLPLIISDGSLRGTFFKGDELKFKGYLVDIENAAQFLSGTCALLNLSDDIIEVNMKNFPFRL